MNTVQLKTDAATHIVVRDAAGTKLVDINLLGCSITIAVPPDAEIQTSPTKNNPQESQVP
jgi:hypothetical protein